MTRASALVLRALDALILLAIVVIVAVLVTGGWTIRVGPLVLPVTRPEDVLVTATLLAALRWWCRPPTVRPARPGRAVAIGVALYTVAFSALTVSRHFALQTHSMDLGYYVQVLWNIAQGAGPRETMLEQHAWAGHLSPILYLFVPLAWTPSLPAALLIVQSAWLALGAVPLYLMAAPRVGDGFAAALSILYLLNPSLHGVNVRDFHSAALAIPLLLAAMYAVDARRPALFVAATALVLATREDAAIAVVGLGLWLACARRRWISGLVLAVVALGVLFVDVSWVVPFFQGGGDYPYLPARYGHLGDSLGTIILSPVLRPAVVFHTLVNARRATYALALLAPFAFLPLLAPLEAIGAVTALAQNLLNSDPILFNYRSQYQSFVLPFLCVGAIGGVQALAWVRRPRWVTTRGVLAMAAALAILLSARTLNDFAVNRWWPGERQLTARRFFAQIPPGASVSAGDRFVPHLALRPKIFVYPRGVSQSDYVLVDASDVVGRHAPESEVPKVGNTVDVADEKERRVRFAVIDAGAHLLLLQRPGS